jgi:hypothetical protein
MDSNKIFAAAKFLTYATQFDPDLLIKLEGALPEEINVLQDVVGVNLPSSYREFLSLMGRNPAWIKLGRDHGTSSTTNIVEVIKAYRQYINTRSHRIPPNCIAISVLGPDFDVCLDLSPDSDEPRVVISEGFAIYQEYAETLNQLLFRLAFLHYQPYRWPHFGLFRSSDRNRIVDQGQSLAASAGLSPLWFSDRNAFCGESLTAAIGLRQYQDDYLIATIAAQTESEFLSLRETLSTQLNLRQLR